MIDEKKFISDVLNITKPFLMINDLDSAYKSIEDYIDDNNYNVKCISIFTKLCLDKGINPIDYFSSNIYDYCFYGLDINAEDGLLSLPHNIKKIGDYAFYGIKGITKVDLRHITFIRQCAFMDSEVKEVYLSPETSFIGPHTIFKNCNLEKIYLPFYNSEDFTIKRIKKLFNVQDNVVFDYY